MEHSRSGRPSGRSALVTDEVQRTNGAGGEGTSSNSAEMFQCLFPGCERTFTTTRGRGVHQRSAHPDFQDAQARPQKHFMWNREADSILALKEIELTRAGVRFINQELAQAFPERTLDSIKSRRRQPVYRRVLAELQNEEPEHGGLAIVEVEDESPSGSDLVQALVGYLRDLPELSGDDPNTVRLNRLCRDAGDLGGERALAEVSLFLRAILPPKSRGGQARRPASPGTDQTRRKARRAAYASTQNLWQKNRSRCIGSILEGEVGEFPPPVVMDPFWSTMMMRPNDITPEPSGGVEPINDLWKPIQLAEVEAVRFSLGTAAGPDGVGSMAYRQIPANIMMRLFNLFMFCGRLPGYLGESATTLIPKKAGALEPGDYRPITVSSIIVRAFHKILANRLSALLPLDPRQRAFRTTDGCAESTFLLDYALRFHHVHAKPLYLASIDVAKAFDSVSHATILQTLRLAGVPTPMVNYVEESYRGSVTRLKYGGHLSEPIKPSCGVKQGDPMSPMIFNLVIDRLIKKLPTNVGVDMHGTWVNIMAFADDIILLASTKEGLQSNLDKTICFLESCGLSANTQKCLTVALRTVPQEKRVVIDTTAIFRVNGVVIPALKRTDEFKYLGIPFSPDGRMAVNPTIIIDECLEKLTKAPLKPQQRLFGLRVYVLTKIYHLIALGKIKVGVLNKIDRRVRKAIRGWCCLHHDVPNGYFHAAVSDGGLGVPSVRWLGPQLRLKRLKRLDEGVGERSLFRQQEILDARRRLEVNGTVLERGVDIRRKWAEALHGSVDGKALAKSDRVPGQHVWVSDGTRFLSGRDYVNSVRLRIGALPTKARMRRGRPGEKLCRGGCGVVESLNHILQHCHRTHGARVKRHDAVVNYIARSLEHKGFQVEKEVAYATDEGIRKPDIVAVKGQKALIIDAQINSEQTDLDVAHRRKASYYGDNIGLRRAISNRRNVNELEFTSATLSWRGLWGPQSVESLTRLGAIRKSDVRVLASRVVIGGMAIFGVFNRTTMTWNRQGIG